MDDIHVAAGIKDRGGRRLGIDRREFSIPSYYPETRSGQDRRGSLERRRKDDFLVLFDPKRRTDRYGYQFYVVNDGYEEPDLNAILPERRKDRRRITQMSIMKLGQLAVGSYVDPSKIYFKKIAYSRRKNFNSNF